MKKLSEASLEKYNSTIKRLDKANLTSKEALSLSDSELKSRLNFHGKPSSFKGLKANIRNIDQSTNKDNQRSKDLIEYAVSKGKTTIAKKIIREKVIKTMEKNKFWFGVDKAKDLGYTNPIKATDTSIRRVKKFGYNRLNKRQKAIIDAISP